MNIRAREQLECGDDEMNIRAREQLNAHMDNGVNDLGHSLRSFLPIADYNAKP
jgi:hypothetical protein